MREIEIHPVPIARLGSLLSPERADRLARVAVTAQGLLAGTTVWNISATAKGGGVAEMLQTLLAYGRGAQVDTRWLVLDGDDEFFTFTKRLHNLLHGSPGDGGAVGPSEQDHFARVSDHNLAMARQLIRPGDIVLLHDPQTAGMVDGLREQGARVIWRSHIGSDTSNSHTERGWSFLRDLLKGADGFIFSRQAYVPDWLPADRVAIIPPSIDPFSAKNTPLDDARVRASLSQAGLVSSGSSDGRLDFARRGGSVGRVRPHRDLVLDGSPIPAQARLVAQVSRWDRLKDMAGVLNGFAGDIARLPPDVHLALIGPQTAGVADDPEGAEVLEECKALWSDLPDTTRHRVHLVCLPMDDVDENAHLVNALQHHARVVVQKSLVEGFGLTVTEAMWKARPVIASAVGGIQDQIEDGVHGLLIADAEDLSAYSSALERLLYDEDLAVELGQAARAHVRDRFLGDRHLIQYVELFGALMAQ